MHHKLIKILLLAVGVAALAAIFAITMIKPEPETAVVTKMAEMQNLHPHRDMLEDTVVPVPAPAPAPAPPVAGVSPVPSLQQRPASPSARPAKLALQLDHLAGSLKISSPVLQPGGRIPLEYSCYRKNKSPPLSWKDAPGKTKSLVVFFEAIDAAEGDSLQWAIYNIPVAATTLAEAMPREPVLTNGYAQALNDAGNIGYVGPCKPKGEFPFLLRVFALDIDLNLSGGLKKDDLIRAMNGHIIDMAAMKLVHYYRL